MKKSPLRSTLSRAIRRPFGGSDRPHHLMMSKYCVVPSAVAASLIGQHMGVDSLTGFVMALGASWACLAQEDWASADRDEEEKRKPGNGHYYWLPFGVLVSHRSWISHGLVWGTAIRLTYGFVGLPWVLLVIVPPLGIAWIVGAFVNDAGHLLLDV
jgi:hypothetical protein